MKEFRIIFKGYFIQEGQQEGLYRLTNKDSATTFDTLDELLSYVELDLKLNVANIQVHETSIITTETMLRQIYNGDFIPSNETDQCSHCLKYYPLEELRKARVDKDSDLEFYCEECYEEVDTNLGFIIGNQKEDES